MMEPFYFGDNAEPLFGVYHASLRAALDRSVAVVLCYPFGQEYLRCHRTFLVLAGLLCSAGYHTLRFDYCGCGDSAGDCDNWSLQKWLSNISTAINELKAGSGADQVCLVGLRLGGALAATAGIESGDIDAMVLWNPVVKGKDHLNELTDAHESWLRGSFARAQSNAASDSREVLGFEITDSMARELRAIDLMLLPRRPAERVLILESKKTRQSDDFAEHLRRLNVRTDCRYVSGPDSWLNVSAPSDKGLVPMPALQSIVAWASEVFE